MTSSARKVMCALHADPSGAMFFTAGDVKKKVFSQPGDQSFFPDSQPRGNDPPGFQPSKRSMLLSRVQQRSIFICLILPFSLLLATSVLSVTRGPMVISGCPRGP